MSVRWQSCFFEWNHCSSPNPVEISQIPSWQEWHCVATGHCLGTERVEGKQVGSPRRIRSNQWQNGEIGTFIPGEIFPHSRHVHHCKNEEGQGGVTRRIGGGLRESRVRRPDCRASRATHGITGNTGAGKACLPSIGHIWMQFYKKRNGTRKRREALGQIK